MAIEYPLRRGSNKDRSARPQHVPVLKLLLLAVLVTFVAVVALAAALFAVRAAHRTRRHRRTSGEGDVADAIRTFRRTGDRAGLTDALSTIAVPALLSAIPKTLSELSPKEKEAFETALARRRFAAYLRGNFRRFDETKRVLACELLAMLGGERSIAFLREAVEDPAYRVRVAALIALAQRGELGDLANCIARLGKRTRRSSRLVQMFALLLPTREGEVRSIVEDTAQDPFVRVSALRALASEGACEDDLLLRLSGDDSPVLVTAVGALSVEYHYASGPAVLERMLAHRSPAVRREAALRSQGMIGGTLPGVLRNSLHDRDPMVVSAAARTLYANGRGPAAIPAPAASSSSRSATAAADAPAFG